jgi:mannose-1-phosphate guanylyltransferase
LIPRQALVLTAGLGTRLRPLTDVRAKPAIPVAGDPMIRHIIRWLVSQGASDLVLNLHYRPETIAAAVGDGADLSARVRYSWEQPDVLGSAGGPRLALPLVGADVFLIVNGDTLTDLDIAPMVKSHAESGARVTLALVPNREFTRYGGVCLEEHGIVTGFVGRGPAAAGSFHFIGVQVVHASAFDAVAAGVPARSIGGVYDGLMVREPGAVRGFVSNAAFWDVGTPADYWDTSWAFAHGEGHRGARVQVDPSARVTRSILWDDVTVGAEAVLEECVVTDRVSIPSRSVHRRAILTRGDDGAVRESPLTLTGGARETVADRSRSHGSPNT